MSWAGPFQYDIGKSRNAQQVPAEVVFDDQVPTLLCLSHLRWSFVYQRPQHLMSRFARDYNVLFHEEPIPTEDAEPWLEVRPEENGVQVLIPRLPAGCWLGRLIEREVGPHTRPMFEIDFAEALLPAVTALLEQYRDGLPVLLHPELDNEVEGHTTAARWLGEPLPLKLHTLRGA